MGDVMTVDEAAARVRVSRKTIFRWIGYGWLRTSLVYDDLGRHREITVDALVEADDLRNNHSLHCAGRRSVKA